MKKLPARQTPTKSERKTILLMTALFILASAALHVLLGGMVPWAPQSADHSQKSMPVVIDVLQTPTPPPPTPRPTPTPKPRPQIQPSPSLKRPTSFHTAAPARPVIAPPAVRPASGGTQSDQNPPYALGSPEQLVAPSPTDYRYVVVSARFINRVQPEYPELAMSEGVEGTVIILLTIGPEGVSDLRVWESSGNAALDRAALQAAKESTYSVPEVNGEPVTETYRVIYTFSLNP